MSMCTCSVVSFLLLVLSIVKNNISMDMNMMTTTLKLNLIHHPMMMLQAHHRIIIPFSPSSSSVNNNITLTHHQQQHTSSSIIPHTSHSHPFPEQPYDDDDQVEVLRVPPHWLLPTNASKESEWLRVTLHKWLDDEYCPEETNVEISRVAAKSYYNSLIQKQADLGDILLNMARELQTISYKESFHGAFSAANAAVSLIAQRIEQFCQPN